MDFALTEEQARWVTRARELAKEFATRARAYDEPAEFPEENVERLRREGFLALAVPREYGGHGTQAADCALTPNLVVEGIAAGCSSTAWNLVLHYFDCGRVAQLGSEEQKRRILGDVARRGALIGSLGSEVNPRQTAASASVERRFTVASELTPVVDGFVVNAVKHFCTLAPVSDYLLFWGMAPGGTDLSDGLVNAIIPRDTRGLSFEEGGWDECMGLRATVTWSARLDNVLIPWENVLGQPGDFVQKDPYTFELGALAHLLGTAQGIVDFVVQFVNERPYLQKEDVHMYQLAEMDAAVHAARMAFWYAAWLFERQRFEEAEVAALRAHHTGREAALLVASKAFEVCGTRACFRFHPVERAWRDIRTASLHTRAPQLMHLLAQGVLDGGRIFSKQKYGQKLASRKSWADLGVPLPADVRS